jgi:tryptophanyl-tRNA synthetase
VRLQAEQPCFFFVADWHALTTHYESPEVIQRNIWDMVVDWLAAGVDPNRSTMFIQSRVPEHAELHLLMSMSTPLGWLERVPTYKDQQEKLTDRDLATYGFLGYPLLQAADILIYRASSVPVGEDQVPHIELTREIARRFNHLFGREAGFEEKVAAAIKQLGGKRGKAYSDLRTRYQERGDAQALAEARALVESSGSLSGADRERLLGFIEGSRKMILSERMTERMKAVIMKRHMELPVGAQEREAKASDEMHQAYIDEANAAGEFEYLRSLRDAHMARIEAWRSMESTARALTRTSAPAQESHNASGR